MLDLDMAAKIAGGGLGIVFLVLAVLWLTIRMTKVVTGKITKLFNKKPGLRHYLIPCKTVHTGTSLHI